MKLIGNKKFYKSVFVLMLPIMFQQLVQTLVQLIDNVMVGRLGDIAMSAVATTNQITFILMLAGFGFLGGAGIFVSQFLGAKDFVSIKKTFQFKLFNLLLIYIIGILVIFFFREPILGLFIGDEDIAALNLASDYSKIVVWCFLPLAVAQAIEMTFRELYMPKYSMYASSSAIVINTILNAILIFGLFGFPALGVKGAAIATVIARSIECLIALFLMKRHGEIFHLTRAELWDFDFTFYKKIYKKSTPLLFNEICWSGSRTILFYAYSTRGLAAITGINITTTLANLAFIIIVGISNTISIMVARELGANHLEKAKDTAYKLLFMSIVLSIITGLTLIIFTPFMLLLYDVSVEAINIASECIKIYGLLLFISAICNCGYFILRSGGVILQTVLIDSGFGLLIQVPIVLYLAWNTDLSAIKLYLIATSIEVFKAIILIFVLRTNIWLKNITLEKV